MDPYALTIYTDGSSYHKPRRGGYGMVFVFPEALGKPDLHVARPGYQQATNNQMELMACIAALEEAQRIPRSWSRIIIRSDSEYVVNNFSNACYVWPKNRWMKSSGDPVLNVVLWKKLVKRAVECRCKVEFQKVKAHSTDVRNNQADKLAKKSAKMPMLNAPIEHAKIRRRSTERVRGEVEIRGQLITLRVVTAKRLTKKIGRYLCEVTPKTNPDYGKTLYICSELILSAGHTYKVRLNQNQSNPKIVKLFGEVQ